MNVSADIDKLTDKIDCYSAAIPSGSVIFAVATYIYDQLIYIREKERAKAKEELIKINTQKNLSPKNKIRAAQLRKTLREFLPFHITLSFFEKMSIDDAYIFVPKELSESSYNNVFRIGLPKKVLRQFLLVDDKAKTDVEKRAVCPYITEIHNEPCSASCGARDCPLKVMLRKSTAHELWHAIDSSLKLNLTSTLATTEDINDYFDCLADKLTEKRTEYLSKK